MADYKITIDDQDALDAIAAEQASPSMFAGGQKGWTVEQYFAEYLTRELINCRREQVAAEASKAVSEAVQAFDDKQAAKAAQAAADAIAPIVSEVRGIN